MEKEIYTRVMRFHLNYRTVKKKVNWDLNHDEFEEFTECSVTCYTPGVSMPSSKLKSMENGHFVIEVPSHVPDDEDKIINHAEYQVYRIIDKSGNMVNARCVQVFPAYELPKVRS